jgi:OOP family OmpA-OmpF porin
VKKLALFAFAWLAAGAVRAQTAPAAAPPIVVSGMLADEAAKGALLARLRLVFGAERIVDQLSVGPVSAPPNWNDYLGKLVGPNLKLVSHGQLKVDGSAVTLRGDVASEAQHQQIAADLAASLHSSYTVSNGLRVVASEQSVLDAALANRIIEFESGKAALTDTGKAILDQMSVALMKVRGKKVAVIGHTDNVGARSANLALSEARAAAVKAYVTGKGIDPATISVSGAGPDRPAASNGNAAGRMRNRRIEFRIDP